MPQRNPVNHVLAALEYEAGINLRDFPVQVQQRDGTLRLDGTVADIAAKRKALRAARRAAGTDRIEDRLRLRVTRPRPEREHLNIVLKALAQEPAFAGLHIDEAARLDPAPTHEHVAVTVRDSTVELRGHVRSLSHRRLAEVICWWIPGTGDVHNHLTVAPAEQETDDELSDAIRMVFDKEPALDPEQIQVNIDHGRVTLKGVVFSSTQKRIAGEDCWYIPGVHAVSNELQIRPR